MKKLFVFLLIVIMCAFAYPTFAEQPKENTVTELLTSTAQTTSGQTESVTSAETTSDEDEINKPLTEEQHAENDSMLMVCFMVSGGVLLFAIVLFLAVNIISNFKRGGKNHK